MAIFPIKGFIKRPVIHLYMLGWGLPLALCSIIISITRHDYIQTPFSYCFTNEPNILIGSVVAPMLLVCLTQFALIIMTLRTLRSILVDLKRDQNVDDEDDDADERLKISPSIMNGGGDKVDDREELCKNWINSKSMFIQ